MGLNGRLTDVRPASTRAAAHTPTRSSGRGIYWTLVSGYLSTDPGPCSTFSVDAVYLKQVTKHLHMTYMFRESVDLTSCNSSPDHLPAFLLGLHDVR